MNPAACKAVDLVVVGGSFAGLVAAKRAAERGLSVVVLERKPEPGARIHTTGILVAEAAAEIDPPAELVRQIDGVRLYAPNLKHVDLTSPGYYFLAIDAAGLLCWLAAEAEAAGAEIRCAASFEGAERHDASIVIAAQDLTTRYLIGADGARSQVAERFGLGRNQRFLLGLEIEYDQVGGLEPGYLHTFLDSRIAPGYLAWLVPGRDVVQVGLACKRADRPDLHRFIDKMSSHFDFSESRIVERRSGVIPVGGCVHPAGANRVLLIGDAAGMVSPMTAGGIYTAFHYAKAAADGVADYLSGDAPDPAAVLPPTYPRFGFKRWMRRALDLGPPNWMLNLAIGTRPMAALARLVYFHTKGLGSKNAWRDVVKGGD